MRSLMCHAWPERIARWCRGHGCPGQGRGYTKALLTPLVLGGMVGASWAQDPVLDNVAPGYGATGHHAMVMPAPFGSYVRGWQAAQVFKAQEDTFVIYLQEWRKDTT